jgi:hypothetical protein
MLQSFGLTYLIAGVLWFLPVAYLILRWRAYKENQPKDPQLGFKTVLYYFKSLGYQVLLAGAAVLIAGLMLGDEAVEEMLRLGAALVLGGGVVYVSHAVILLRRTNTNAFPGAARLYNGFNMALVALVGMAALIAFFVILFSEAMGRSAVKTVLAVLLVYCPAWVAQGAFLLRNSRQVVAPPTGTT